MWTENQVRRLGEFCEVQTGPFGSQLHAQDYVENGTPIITVEHLGDNEVLHKGLPLVSDADRARLNRYGLRAGDIVFSRVGAIDRRAFVSEREDGWLFSGRLLRVRPNPSVGDGRYLSYLLGHPEAIGWIRNHSVGSTMACLNTSILAGVPTLLPPLPEQIRIAEILDTLDEAIRKTEQVIAKLQQMKQGLLRDLLTRGVDENGDLRPPPDQAPHLYKDSVLGLVPKGWEVTLVAEEFSIQSGVTMGPHRTPRSNPLPYLRVANVFHRRLDLTEISMLEARQKDIPAQLLRPGDLLVVEGHANVDEIGRAALVDERVTGYTYQNHLFRLRSLRLLPFFGEAWMNSHTVRCYWRRMCSTSSGLHTINQSLLRAVATVVPSKAEQYQIAGVIAAHDARLNRENVSREMYFSLKQGLLHDLLTGRVRVPIENVAEEEV